ncbi:hypothetical protein DSO57_1007795 [Entomophthora muscae]|uniref:Uncharacterized protein n=1 Tax=Entomophthora muscae TaxID=34485 RepID=A0ACC2RM26_9FUNG|nr:hypothetical protein DSO57_1007795 [Entomophthora muscae]
MWKNAGKIDDLCLGVGRRSANPRTEAGRPVIVGGTRISSGELFRPAHNSKVPKHQAITELNLMPSTPKKVWFPIPSGGVRSDASLQLQTLIPEQISL